MNEKKCANCQTELQGTFCHQCGEKIISATDFTLLKLIEQTIDVFTHLDSKLFKTVRYLLFKPGQLSLAYVEGRRKPYMKPIQIFLLINVLFFLLLSDADVFRKPAVWWFHETSDMGFNIQNLVSQKALALAKTAEEVALLYDQKSKTVAKTFIIILVPVMGVLLWGLFAPVGLQIGKHVIFSTHFISFTLLLMVFWGAFLNFVGTGIPGKYHFWPLQVVLFVYLLLGCRHFYKTKWLYTIFGALIGLVVFNIFILAYRFGISLYSLTSM